MENLGFHGQGVDLGVLKLGSFIWCTLYVLGAVLDWVLPKGIMMLTTPRIRFMPLNPKP